MIDAEDIRRLLDTDHSVLVVVSGRAEVLDAEAVDGGWFRGALEVVSHDGLVDLLGTSELSDRELDEQAAALTVAVNQMGG